MEHAVGIQSLTLSGEQHRPISSITATARNVEKVLVSYRDSKMIQPEDILPAPND
jgi:hypothetical protein